MSLLYGLHDREGRHIVPPGGWVVDTISLSDNPAPTDYTALRGDINWIVRLNWGYGMTGTIPPPHQFDHMARAAAAYVHNSRGARIWIIGNEPNHEQERPNGVFITPQEYARCFKMCRDAIKQANSLAHVIPAPCAPYHANPVDWLAYWHDMLRIIEGNGGCDGIAVHAYTRSSNPEDLSSLATMGPPLQDQHSGFLSFVDALDEVPATLRHLPAYITEFNELLPDGWHDANTGVVQAAYKTVDDWNRGGGLQEISCLILYRWPKYDKWHIEGKQGVIDDFRAAVAKGYKSPQINAQNYSNQETIQPAPMPQSTLPPRDIDPRAIDRGVTIQTPQVRPGQPYWRVKSLRWYDESEADRLGPDRHIMVDTLDEQGQRVVGVPVRVGWPNDSASILTEAKMGEPYAQGFGMSPSRNEYNVSVDTTIPSETVRGIGMGSETPSGFNAGIHTSTAVVFQRAIAPSNPPIETHLPAVGTGPTPAPTGPTAIVSTMAGANIREAPSTIARILGAVVAATPLPVVGKNVQGDWWKVRTEFGEGWVSATVVRTVNVNAVPVVETEQPTPSIGAWPRSRAFIARWEGGYQNVHNDAGNWTGGAVGVGENKGTKYGISAASYPHLDIKNLTLAQADAIYYTDYWQASGADKLTWPGCLIVLDTAVLHGTGTAKRWLAEVGPNPLIFAARRLASYPKRDNWGFWGKSWVNRVADLLNEASR